MEDARLTRKRKAIHIKATGRGVINKASPKNEYTKKHSQYSTSRMKQIILRLTSLSLSNLTSQWKRSSESERTRIENRKPRSLLSNPIINNSNPETIINVPLHVKVNAAADPSFPHPRKTNPTLKSSLQKEKYLIPSPSPSPQQVLLPKSQEIKCVVVDLMLLQRKTKNEEQVATVDRAKPIFNFLILASTLLPPLPQYSRPYKNRTQNKQSCQQIYVQPAIYNDTVLKVPRGPRFTLLLYT